MPNTMKGSKVHQLPGLSCRRICSIWSAAVQRDQWNHLYVVLLDPHHWLTLHANLLTKIAEFLSKDQN